MEIEWSGQQQLLFIARSMLAGLIIGVLFEVTNGLGRIHRNRWRTMALDLVFSVLASVITFFASLVIMDGQLHPVLFTGIFIGAFMLHFSVGKYIASCVYNAGLFLRMLISELILITEKIQNEIKRFTRSHICRGKNVNKIKKNEEILPKKT